MHTQIPSREQVEHIAVAGASLLAAIRRYSIRMAGKGPNEFRDFAWVTTHHGLIDAVQKLECLLNPRRLALPHPERGFRFTAGWQFGTVCESLKWLKWSQDELLRAMKWEAICEGKGLTYLLTPEKLQPRDEWSGFDTHCICEDTKTFTWPKLDSDLIAQLEESVYTLKEALGHQFVRISARMSLDRTNPELPAPIDRTPDNKTDKRKNSCSIPESQDVVGLARLIKSKLGRPGFPTKLSVALEFTNGNLGRANSLLRQLQPSRHGNLLD
jgi:hypothetical protein